MMSRNLSFHGSSLALVAALVLAACGGGNSFSPPTPVPTPVPTPTPEPQPTPIPPPAACRPIPPPISRIKLDIHLKNRDFWTIDATAQVGPNPQYCRKIGFTDGRRYCPVRQEGDPLRHECEGWTVGRAEDTGRYGVTWTNPDGEYCTGPESLCVNSDDNQYFLWIFKGGMFKACARNGVCAEIFTDKDL